jgi:hypothetical protein
MAPPIESMDIKKAIRKSMLVGGHILLIVLILLKGINLSVGLRPLPCFRFLHANLLRKILLKTFQSHPA